MEKRALYALRAASEANARYAIASRGS